MAEQPAMTQEMVEKWAGLRMAHEAAMVEDLQQVLRANRQAVAAHHTANGLPVSAEESGVIHVGNVTNNLTQPTPAPAAAKGLSTLAKTGIAAALLGSGAAVPLAVNALWPDDTKQVVEQVFDPSKWEIVIPQEAAK